MKYPTDITGFTFDRLTAIRRVPGPVGTRNSYWECRCVCGTVKAIARTSLTKTHRTTRSCGCWMREMTGRPMVQHAPLQMRNMRDFVPFRAEELSPGRWLITNPAIDAPYVTYGNAEEVAERMRRAEDGWRRLMSKRAWSGYNGGDVARARARRREHVFPERKAS